MATINVGEKTHQPVLPQRVALESVSADKPGVGTKRDTDTAPTAVPGVDHGRGERFHHTRHRGENRHGRKASAGIPVHAGSDPGAQLNQETSPIARRPRVFVLDKNHQPLMPCHPMRARVLLRKGRARVHKLHPFTIRVIDRTVADSEVDGVQIKIDPGSRHSGMAVSRTEDKDVVHGLFAMELTHRGHHIHRNMQRRAALRRTRRSRNLRYRKPRFANRVRPKGWLAPSLRHRVETITGWVNRLCKLAPVTGVATELVRFDLQKQENPEITGMQYQQGTLAGCEVREYLLEKWRRECAYCGASGVPLNIDHITARSRGGSDRVSNLTLACIRCNQEKGNRPVEQFVTDPIRLSRFVKQAKIPLRDAAAVNSTRWGLYRELTRTGLPVTTGSGGQTKWNRTRVSLPKSHTLDALCVGETKAVASYPSHVLVAVSHGRGAYARTRADAYGFPRLYLTRTKRHFGFATGDLVRATVPSGKHAGTHTGRVAVRATGSFNVFSTTAAALVQGVSHRHCRLLEHGDGWSYTRRKEAALLPALKDGVSARIGR